MYANTFENCKLLHPKFHFELLTFNLLVYFVSLNLYVYVLDKTYSLQQKNVSQVATTITETRTISFNLPGDIVQDHDFKLKNVVAFSREDNVEFVYNIKSKICNGKLMPIHHVSYYVAFFSLFCIFMTK